MPDGGNSMKEKGKKEGKFGKRSIVLGTIAIVGLAAILMTAAHASAATINVPGDQPTIQDAIDAASDGDTIVVGTYTESVTINKSIDLVGQPGAIIKCPATPKTVKVQESGHTFEYVVLAAGGTYGSGNNTYYGTGTINVGITGFEVDGNNGGTSSSYYFTGILLRNAVGNISDNYIHDMYGPSGDGSGEQTFGMLIYGNSDATVYGNTVENFSRGGIVANGEAGPLADPVVDIKNNIVYGNGRIMKSAIAGSILQDGLRQEYW